MRFFHFYFFNIDISITIYDTGLKFSVCALNINNKITQLKCTRYDGDY